MKQTKQLTSVRVYEEDKKILIKEFGSVQKALDETVNRCKDPEDPEDTEEELKKESTKQSKAV